MVWNINAEYYEKIADKFYEKFEKGDRSVEEWDESKVEISEHDLSSLSDGLKHAVDLVRWQRDEIKKLQKQLVESDSIESMTHALELHYGQVVRPVNEYCQAFYDWHDAIVVKVTELKERIEENTPKMEELFGEIPENMREYRDEKSERINLWYRFTQDRDDLERWQKCLDALNNLHLFIVKSDYLRRRIYAKEGHRTEKCPTHQGRWSGIRWPGTPPQEGCLCQEDDGNVSGWLPLDE